MKNVELKIQVANFSEINKRLEKIRASWKGILRQIDTYYNCRAGRLKFREENGRKFQLVFYIRPNKDAAKVSDYNIIEFDKKETQALKALLRRAYGEKVIVKKERQLWMYKNTRIHLDKVERVGTFLELETVVIGTLSAAQKEYAEVVKLLDLEGYRKFKKSYSDILMKKYGGKRRKK